MLIRETMGHLTSIQGRKQLCGWNYVTAQGSYTDFCSAIPALHPKQPRRISYSLWDLKEIKTNGILPFCMNLLLLDHIFQQKFPERTVQSGEEGKKKKPKWAEHNQKHSPRSSLGKGNNSKTALLLKVNSDDQRKRHKITVLKKKIVYFLLKSLYSSMFSKLFCTSTVCLLFSEKMIASKMPLLHCLWL